MLCYHDKKCWHLSQPLPICRAPLHWPESVLQFLNTIQVIYRIQLKVRDRLQCDCCSMSRLDLSVTTDHWACCFRDRKCVIISGASVAAQLHSMVIFSRNVYNLFQTRPSRHCRHGGSLYQGWVKWREMGAAVPSQPAARRGVGWSRRSWCWVSPES